MDTLVKPLTRSQRIVMSLEATGSAINEKIDFFEIFNTSIASLGALSFGLYTTIFVSAGGVFWLWAIPCGVIALGMAGWAGYSALRIVR